MKMLKCIKQHLSNIWSLIHEKVKQHWLWVDKERCLQKNACHLFEYINEYVKNSRSPDLSRTIVFYIK